MLGYVFRMDDNASAKKNRSKFKQSKATERRGRPPTILTIMSLSELDRHESIRFSRILTYSKRSLEVEKHIQIAGG